MEGPNHPQKDKLLTTDFVFICLASFAFFSSFNLLLATLPIYVLHIGGGVFDVGLVTGFFAATALVSRPFVGRGVDERGAKSFLILGALTFIISSFLYNVATNMSLLFGLRLLHGVGLGIFTTAANAFVAETAPLTRRGEAVGIFGTSANLGQAIGPGLGLTIMNLWGFVPLFLAAAGLSLVCLLAVMVIKEEQQWRVTAGDLSYGTRGAMFVSEAFFPAAILLALTVTYGCTISFLPLFAKGPGPFNAGLFFIAFAFTIIIVRTLSGQLSDRYGRAVVIIPGMGIVALSMFILMTLTLGPSSSVPLLALAGVLYGLGFGATHPCLMAEAIDRTNAGSRGAAMGTFSGAYDLGVALGGMVLGVVLQVSNFPLTFAAAAMVAVLGMLYYAAGARRRNPSPRPTQNGAQI
ncbi:MAG: MFS transporter [Chloroflexi bacterium]|nr:MFS transporter [Chloroflexota bacterium]